MHEIYVYALVFS